MSVRFVRGYSAGAAVVVNLGEGSDVHVAVQLFVILAQIAGKAADILKDKGAVECEVRLQNGLVHSEGLRRLRPLGEEGIVVPIVQHLCGFCVKERQKCFKGTALVGAVQRGVEIPFDRAYSRKMPLAGLTLVGGSMRST